MATPVRPTPAGDPVTVDPKHYSVEFENDKVRVLRIKYGPGEKSVMHAHPALVAVFLTDGKVRASVRKRRQSRGSGLIPSSRGDCSRN